MLVARSRMCPGERLAAEERKPDDEHLVCVERVWVTGLARPAGPPL